MSTKSISKKEYSVEEIDITPDVSLMPKLGYAGYSAPQAIGELVDNAIDARNDNALLKVNINIQGDSISVADNGSGMDKEIASKALVLAFSKKQGKLGEFGLGLKTACLSMGDYFEIITTSLGDSLEYQICFDRKAWEMSDKGWSVPLRKKETRTESHFTIININKLKIFYPNLHNYIRADLKKRYAPFIRTGEVEIKVNGKCCEPESFLLIEETKKEFNISLKSGRSITGWYALLKEGSQKGLYGFHTFRRGRMITTYDKIGFDPHPTLARIIGEIHMDHVPVTHNKREFIKESSEYKEAEVSLREELKDIVRLARRKANQDTVTPEVKREVDVWKDKIGESLRSEEFKNYTARLKNIEVVADPNGSELKNVEVEKREEKKAETKPKPELKDEKERVPRETHLQKKHIIRIKGKNIEFRHSFSPLGVKESWKTYTFETEKGLDIYTNTDFPAYLVTRDKPFYAVIHIAEAISEVLVQAAQEDIANIDELKQLILRKASELKAQI